MKRLLLVTETASLDLERLRAWLTQPGAGSTARARLDAIVEAIDSLADEPQFWPDGDVSGTQERIVAGHTIVYRADYRGSGRTGATRVEIIRVFGPGQLRRFSQHE